MTGSDGADPERSASGAPASPVSGWAPENADPSAFEDTLARPPRVEPDAAPHGGDADSPSAETWAPSAAPPPLVEPDAVYRPSDAGRVIDPSFAALFGEAPKPAPAAPTLESPHADLHAPAPVDHVPDAAREPDPNEPQPAPVDAPPPPQTLADIPRGVEPVDATNDDDTVPPIGAPFARAAADLDDTVVPVRAPEPPATPAHTTAQPKQLPTLPALDDMATLSPADAARRIPPAPAEESPWAPDTAPTATVATPAAPQAPASGIEFFRVRIGLGVPIPLEHAIVIGRRPTAPRIPDAQSRRLVTVPSPSGEVSGSHLEIAQVGRTVVLTDLKSTNGSIVAAPGTPRRRLRQGESLVVAAGTVVEIGDGNVVEILTRPRIGEAP